MDFQNAGWTCEMEIQGASLLFIVKNCFKRDVGSLEREQTSTDWGKDHVLTASAEYEATSA